MAKNNKVKSLRAVMPKNDDVGDITDSVSYWKRHDSELHVKTLVLQAQRCWDAMDKFRRSRDRAKKYTYGNQWQDKIVVDGVSMTEEEYIKSQGSVPMSQNLIRRLVRNVVGVFRNQNKEPMANARDRNEQVYGEINSTLLQYNYQLNKKRTLNGKMLEDALIGGMVAEKKTAGRRQDRGNRFDAWTDKVLMNMFFIDSNSTDVFCRDARIIGEIHEFTFAKLCSLFAENQSDIASLSKEYGSANSRDNVLDYYRNFGYSELKNVDFMCPYDVGMCRVIEIWNIETREMLHCWDMAKGVQYDIAYKDKAELVDKENERRIAEGISMGMDINDIAIINCKKEDEDKDDWFVQEYWYYRFVTPYGRVLKEGETPYAHGLHPYVVFAYPFIDGEIHSFVSDVIDQQRYINRLVTMYDWIMRCSAKGLLLAPEGAFDGQDIDKVAETWSSFNGVLMYKPKAGVAAPQQISGNMTNVGIVDMLNKQITLMEDISGVNGALQGKPGYSSTSGTLYAQQTLNATTSLVDLLECFSEFIIDCAYKDLSNILQFYDDKMIKMVVDEKVEWKDIDTEKIRDIVCDISIQESTSSPVYRQIANEFLMQLLQQQAISVEQLLEVGDFPFADKLLQTIRSQQEQLQAAQGGMMSEEGQQ